MIKKALEQERFPFRTISRQATSDELQLVHTADYVETVLRDCQSRLRELSTGDVALSKNSYPAACGAAATVIEAVKSLFTDEIKRAFCLVRPPGHHASADKGEGFCIFNNAALAARYAQKEHGIKRVAILDWDVHHGNGTEAIFREDPSVLYFSTHQSPLYPGTGVVSVNQVHNFPIKAGPGSREEVLRCFREELPQVLKEFRPELILISCGFDAREGDTLGGFNLTDKDFADLTNIVTQEASLYAQGRVISILEGGYALEGIASAAVAHTRALFL